jgi:hypothetical protein
MQVFLTLNDVKSKNEVYQSFITHQDLQTLLRPLLSFEKVVTILSSNLTNPSHSLGNYVNEHKINE